MTSSSSSSPAFLAAATEEELQSVLEKVSEGDQEDARFGGDAKQRGMAHRAARALGLLAASEGDGEGRHVRVWRRPPAAAAEPADDDDEECEEEEGWGEEEEEEAEEDEPLQPFDLYKALGLQKGFGGGDARVRSSYHRLALAARQHLRDCEERGDDEAEAEAWLRFRRVTVAAGVLLDKGRREVYEQLGFTGLQGSEKYYELSVFDDDPHDRLDRFFNGVDEDDREYLLLNGAGPPSDDDEAEEEDDIGGDSDEEALVEALEAPREPRHTRLHVDSDCEEGLPAPPPGVVLGASSSGLGVPSVKHTPHDPFAALAAKLGAAAAPAEHSSDQKDAVKSNGKQNGGGKASRKKQKT